MAAQGVADFTFPNRRQGASGENRYPAFWPFEKSMLRKFSNKDAQNHTNNLKQNRQLPLYSHSHSCDSLILIPKRNKKTTNTEALIQICMVCLLIFLAIWCFYFKIKCGTTVSESQCNDELLLQQGPRLPSPQLHGSST